MEPPLSEVAPERWAEPGAPATNPNREAYEFVADKVGFVPNVRRSDNILQAKIFGGVWLGCVLLGAVCGGMGGALMGLLLGIVVALLVSGAVLAIVGLKR